MRRALVAVAAFLLGVLVTLGADTILDARYEYRVIQFREAMPLVNDQGWQLERSELGSTLWYLRRPRLRLP